MEFAYLLKKGIYLVTHLTIDQALSKAKLFQKTLNKLTVLYNQGEYKDVVKQSQTYLDRYPNDFIIWNLYGLGNLALGKDLIALDSFKKSILINPKFTDGINNLGVTLEKKGRLDDAISTYFKAISINTSFYQAYNNIGNILRKKGDFTKAINMFYKAISIEPNYIDARSNLAIALQERGRTNESINALKKVLSLKPDCSSTINTLGNIYKDQEKFDDAIAMYSKAISINPDFEMAIAQKLFMLAIVCDWKSIEGDKPFIDDLGKNKNFITTFSLLSLEDNPLNHKKRSEIFAKVKYPQKPIPFNTLISKSKKRIRIGYFSSDFYDHATMRLMSKILTLHDRQRFEVFAYSFGTQKNDYMRQNLINSVDVFDDVSQMSDKDVALLARQDEIDIAIDLKGHTQNNRSGIFAYRAAPIQINYLGYPGTMGANFIDYLIADSTIIPEEYKNYYSEEIIYMPHSYQPTNNNRLISQKEMTRSGMGLPEDSFVFCCFNNSYKITSVEFDIWMNLLKQVEGSVLWLLKTNKWAQANLRKEAENRGVNQDRIIFAGKLPQAEHLARQKLADLFIDTFNVNAHTTASDALWGGLPVVTKTGKGFAARVAASLLNAIDLPELVTENKKDYESLILELAHNREKLKEIKDKLIINRMSKPLFDSEMYTKHLENGYQQIYQNFIDGNKPKTININL